MNENQTLLEFINNDIKHYKEILICNKDDEHIQTYYTHRLNYYNKLKEVVTIYNAIITKPYKPLKERDCTLEEVKQLWEELEYECIEFGKKFIKLEKNIFNVQKIIIEICYGSYSKDFRYMKYGESHDSRLFTLEEHNLITKTIKALEREEKHDYS